MTDGGLQPTDKDHSDLNLQTTPPEKSEAWWVEVLKTLGLALILAFGIRTFVAEARYIPSGSMEPTLEINDRLIVEKIGYYFHPPHRGDIVVFNPTDTLQAVGFRDAFIKRIIGMPGDKVAIQAGRVFINGQPFPEPYLPNSVFTTIDTCAGMTPFLGQPQVIPANSYLVLGDNRGNSLDGRCWGVVPRDHIIGRAAVRFWPPSRWSVIPDGNQVEAVKNP
ncbi:signal peptidase I [Synechococcus sp. PCC 6312]|uniref:signal peptidase I n=1 Tax=Synechococcus sp. (strain ATCC 27167 / PCC 6312) TaxID=195253 RepID=UPI00029F23B8|nr:signal peptidase I [Synechococcus sp. PCC 6312]AFY61714.1 signal peptidase I [Synechococcus sp. PCC 6312]